MARHKRFRHAHEQIISIVAEFRADFQNIAKTLGGDQARRHTAPFDQRIGDQRGAVNDMAHFLCPRTGTRQQITHAFQHGFFRGVGRGEHLAIENPPIAGIEHDQISEGAANINTNAPGCWVHGVT